MFAIFAILLSIVFGYAIYKLKQQQAEENDDSIVTTVLAEPSIRSSRIFVEAPLIPISNEERPSSINQRDSLEPVDFEQSPSDYNKM